MPRKTNVNRILLRFLNHNLRCDVDGCDRKYSRPDKLSHHKKMVHTADPLDKKFACDWSVTHSETLNRKYNCSPLPLSLTAGPAVATEVYPIQVLHITLAIRCNPINAVFRRTPALPSTPRRPGPPPVHTYGRTAVQVRLRRLRQGLRQARQVAQPQGQSQTQLGRADANSERLLRRAVRGGPVAAQRHIYCRMCSAGHSVGPQLMKQVIDKYKQTVYSISFLLHNIFNIIYLLIELNYIPII